ncbi:MAG: imidazole glycerol phosphate synthase subunit HisF [Dehalococcoidales bacterium]|nr:imidazole glycerol phosphate synthase subunit HisF [Dehalococcoidales bacterium]
MLSKRVIVCLDVRAGKLAKSIKFVDTKDIGDPIEKARQYYEDGVDELVFYDITASREERDIMIHFVEEVANQIFIPFSVGGGIRSVEDATKLRNAGAEKVNVNTAAIKRRELISEISRAIGAQSTVLSMDIRKCDITEKQPSGYEIVINGGVTPTGIDALWWARTGEELGAGELVINSIDADGTRDGYELNLTRMIADAVGIPVIASGGAGKPEHLYEAFVEGHADAALVASIVHYNEYTTKELKDYLSGRGIKVRTHF